jgi:hypothetical protein
MTLHVSSRVVSRLVVFVAVLLGLSTPAGYAEHTGGSATKAFTPTLIGMLVDEGDAVGSMRSRSIYRSSSSRCRAKLHRVQRDDRTRVIHQVERIEVNVQLPADTFTLEPSAAAVRKR